MESSCVTLATVFLVYAVQTVLEAVAQLRLGNAEAVRATELVDVALGLQATVALVRAVWAVDCAVAIAAPGNAHGAVLALELIVGATEVTVLLIVTIQTVVDIVTLPV